MDERSPELKEAVDAQDDQIPFGAEAMFKLPPDIPLGQIACINGSYTGYIDDNVRPPIEELADFENEN